MTSSASTTSRRRSLKEARLRELLARREAVATTWAERISHGLGDVGSLLQELTILEFALIEHWPHLTERDVRQWVVADAKKLHDPTSAVHMTCSLCRAASQIA